MEPDRNTLANDAADLLATIRANGGRLTRELCDLETLLDKSLRKVLQLQPLQRTDPDAVKLQNELTEMRIQARRTIRQVWKALDEIKSALDLSSFNSETTKNDGPALFPD